MKLTHGAKPRIQLFEQGGSVSRIVPEHSDRLLFDAQAHNLCFNSRYLLMPLMYMYVREIWI